MRAGHVEPDGWDVRGRSLSWTRLLVAEDWPKPIPVRLQRPREAWEEGTLGATPGDFQAGEQQHCVSQACPSWAGTGHPPGRKSPRAACTCRGEGQAATDIIRVSSATVSLFPMY